jgi:hypothetical protein
MLSGLNFLEERDNAKGLRAGLLVGRRRRQRWVWKARRWGDVLI